MFLNQNSFDNLFKQHLTFYKNLILFLNSSENLIYAKLGPLRTLSY